MANPRVTKAELVNALADKVGMNLTKKQVKAVLEAFTSYVTASVKKGNSVVLTGFGRFSRKEVQGRKGLTPLTKKPYTSKDHFAPAFKAGKQFQDAVK